MNDPNNPEVGDVFLTLRSAGNLLFEVCVHEVFETVTTTLVQRVNGDIERVYRWADGRQRVPPNAQPLTNGERAAYDAIIERLQSATPTKGSPKATLARDAG